ncbi:MAG TPA: RNA polymerase sigma factor [Candidatus Elarobacter sp.]
MTDDVRAAQAGDADARDRLLRAAWPRAYRLAYAVLGDRASAEDAAQEALIRIDARLGGLREPAAFAVWSARIVMNAARDAARRRPMHDELDERQRSERFDDLAALRVDLAAALSELPGWLREPVVLCYLEGFTSAEAGLALGAPAATIRFRLLLARRRLVAALGDGALRAAGGA